MWQYTGIFSVLLDRIDMIFVHWITGFTMYTNKTYNSEVQSFTHPPLNLYSPFAGLKIFWMF